MKKIVLTAVAVGLAAVAAQAQDRGAIEVTRAAWIGAYEANNHTDANTQKKVDSLARKVAKKAEQENFRRAKQAAQAGQRAKAGKKQRHYNHVPATGAMRDFAVEGRLQEQTATSKAPSAEDEATTAQNTPKAKKQGTVKWLARALGFEKYENETYEEWQARLLAMAMK